MLMAGIDGIKNKIDQVKLLIKIYTLFQKMRLKITNCLRFIREAMQNLDKDRKFLTEGGVFTDDQIDAYMN